MNFRSVSDLTNLITNDIYKIPKDIDLIVGIPRSGMLVANYIALLMNKPLTDVEGLISDRVFISGQTKNTSSDISSVEQCKKILVVDDSVASGESIKECKKKISATKIAENIQIIYCAAYVLDSSKEYVDIYFEVVENPRMFEWNIFHHPMFLKRMCFDIDGVLCVDPTSEQNDDGENYLKFIQEAVPKIIPSGCIGSLVTSRIEKYRDQTERWLEKNGIQYDKLIMLDTTAEERRKNNLHASFKADYYRKTDAILFVESEERQAIEIHNMTGKPVYCLENGLFYIGDLKYSIKYESKLRIYNFISKFKILRIFYSIYAKLMKKGV